MNDRLCVLEHRREPERPRRASPGLLVCAGCRKRLALNLLELPGLHDRLPEAHTARSGHQSEIRSRGHVGLTLSDDVATAGGNLVNALTTWTRLIAEEFRLRFPDDDRPATLAKWLLGHRGSMLDLACEQRWIDEYADNIDTVHAEAFRAVYPRGRRQFVVGDCIEVTACDVATRTEWRCPGRMVATLTDQDSQLPASLACDECGVEVTADRWITYGRRVHKLQGQAS